MRSDKATLSTNDCNNFSFYWPIPRTEIEDVGRLLLLSIVKTVQNSSYSKNDRVVISSLIPKLLVEFISIFQAEVLYKRSVKDNITIELPNCAKRLRKIFSQKELDDSEFILQFEKGL